MEDFGELEWEFLPQAEEMPEDFADEWLEGGLPPPSSSDAQQPVPGEIREPDAKTVYQFLQQQIPESWRKGNKLPEPEERQAREWFPHVFTCDGCDGCDG